jgi:hypothetical protein
MWFVDVDQPQRNLWDSGMAEESRIFRLAPGSELRLEGSSSRWTVLAHIDRVVLLRRIES